ncbi:MAG: hypothetical protein SGPRY_010973 [Prymnesium sp.]
MPWCDGWLARIVEGGGLVKSEGGVVEERGACWKMAEEYQQGDWGARGRLHLFSPVSTGQPTARRMVPPRLSHYGNTHGRALRPADDLSLFVLDYFFISSFEIALSFGEISMKLEVYRDQIRNHVGTRFIPWWSHVVWSWHIRTTLAPMGVRPSFILQHEVDFSLARFWRYGNDCLVRSPSLTPGIDRGFRQATHFALDWMGLNVSSTGVAQLQGDILAEQCPFGLVKGSLLSCAWYSHACRLENHRNILEMGELAARLHREASLTPRCDEM